MKIYNKVVIAWNEETQHYDKVVYEDSYEYEGEMMLSQRMVGACCCDGECIGQYNGFEACDNACTEDFAWYIDKTCEEVDCSPTGGEGGDGGCENDLDCIDGEFCNVETGECEEEEFVAVEMVQIGEQCWMSENLNVTHYRNGDEIPTGYNDDNWAGLTTGAYAVYGGNESNADTYGYLYNWYAVVDEREICPAGWHIPSDAELTALGAYLGGLSVAGGKMKETGTAHWDSPNLGATNESGFTGLPGGYRFSGYGGGYYYMGVNGYFWSSNERDDDSAWDRLLNYNFSDLHRGHGYKEHGKSVRCMAPCEWGAENVSASSCEEDQTCPIQLEVYNYACMYESHTFTFVEESAPAHGSVSEYGDATCSEGDTGITLSVNYQPEADYAGSDSFTYQVTDQVTGAVSSATVEIAVGAAPELVDYGDGQSPTARRLMTAGGTLPLTVIAYDIDRSEATFSVTSNVDWMTVQGGQQTVSFIGGYASAEVYFQQGANAHGVAEITVTVEDETGSVDSETFMLTLPILVNDLDCLGEEDPTDNYYNIDFTAIASCWGGDESHVTITNPTGQDLLDAGAALEGNGTMPYCNPSSGIRGMDPYPDWPTIPAIDTAIQFCLDVATSGVIETIDTSPVSCNQEPGSGTGTWRINSMGNWDCYCGGPLDNLASITCGVEAPSIEFNEDDDQVPYTVYAVDANIHDADPTQSCPDAGGWEVTANPDDYGVNLIEIVPNSIDVTAPPYFLNGARVCAVTFDVRPIENESGDASIDVGITVGGTSTRTIDVNVLSTADAPTFIEPIGDQETDEEEPIDISVSVHDNDPDDTITFSATSVPEDVVTFSFTLESGNVSSSGDIQTVMTVTPVIDFNGDVVITVRAEDSFYEFVEETFTLAVIPVNNPPVITDQDPSPLETLEDTSLEIVLANLFVADADNTYPDDFTLTVLDGDNYTVDETEITPSLNYSGTLTVPVYVDDGAGFDNSQSNTFNLTVIVTAVDEEPYFTSDPEEDEATTATEDVEYTYSVTAADPDGDALTITAPTRPSWLSFNSGTNVLSGTPLNAHVGDHDVILEVTDGITTITQSFTITVSGVGDIAPTIVTPTDFVGDEITEPIGAGGWYSETLVGIDPDGPDETNLLSYFAIVPSFLEFLGGNTNVIQNDTNRPDDRDVGTHTIIAGVTDAGASCSGGNHTTCAEFQYPNDNTPSGYDYCHTDNYCYVTTSWNVTVEGIYDAPVLSHFEEEPQVNQGSQVSIYFSVWSSDCHYDNRTFSFSIAQEDVPVYGTISNIDGSSISCTNPDITIPGFGAPTRSFQGGGSVGYDEDHALTLTGTYTHLGVEPFEAFGTNIDSFTVKVVDTASGLYDTTTVPISIVQNDVGTIVGLYDINIGDYIDEGGEYFEGGYGSTPKIQIGDQCWMKENLKVTHYRNGDELPTGHSNSEWRDLDQTEIGAYAVYDDDSSNADVYGYLYNWHAIIDERGICPEGWHVPDNNDWLTLSDYLGEQSVAGGKLKECTEGSCPESDYWISPNTGATNESGFTGLPGGHRDGSNGYYFNMSLFGYFWSSTESSDAHALLERLEYNSVGLQSGGFWKTYGLSVRCISDTPECPNLFSLITSADEINTNDTIYIPENQDERRYLTLIAYDVDNTSGEVSTTIGGGWNWVDWNTECVQKSFEDTISVPYDLDTPPEETNPYGIVVAPVWFKRTQCENETGPVAWFGITTAAPYWNITGLSINVINVDDPPEVNDVTGTGYEGDTITTILEATDVDTTDPTQLTFEIETQPLYKTADVNIGNCSVTVNTTCTNDSDCPPMETCVTVYYDGTTGLFTATATYTHDGSEDLDDSFTYRAYTTAGEYSTLGPATATITITPVNDPPHWDMVPPNPDTVEQGTTYTSGVIAHDVDDIDENLTLSMEWVDGPGFDWLTLTSTNNTGGLSGFPLQEHVGQHIVKLTVEDDDGAYEDYEYTLEVTNLEENPVWSGSDCPASVNENESWTGCEQQASDPDGFDVTVTIPEDCGSEENELCMPSWISYEISGNGGPSPTVTMGPSTPGWFDAGEYTIKLTVTDSADDTLTYEHDITVVDINRPPVANDVSVTVDEESTTEITLSGYDPDTQSLGGDGYGLVQIGDQCWFDRNLDTTRYTNGDDIEYALTWPSPGGEDSTWLQMAADGIGAFGYQEDNTTNRDTYGNLYNWHAVNDSRGICPEGLHVPTRDEWQILTNYLGGEEIAGGKLKTMGTIEGGDGLWDEPNEGATNEVGFAALPGGFRSYNNGSDSGLGIYAWFSSSTESEDDPDPEYGFRNWSYRLRHNYDHSYLADVFNIMGLSVRCVANAADFGGTCPAETGPVYFYGGGQMTFEIVNSPSHGELGDIVIDGLTTAAVDYTPENNYYGVDSFTYNAIHDEQTSLDPATVSITVNNDWDDAPIISPTIGDQATNEDTVKVIPIIVTDNDALYGDSETLSFSVTFPQCTKIQRETIPGTYEDFPRVCDDNLASADHSTFGPGGGYRACCDEDCADWVVLGEDLNGDQDVNAGLWPEGEWYYATGNDGCASLHDVLIDSAVFGAVEMTQTSETFTNNLTVTPNDDVSGMVSMTVTVTDSGGLSVSEEFDFTIVGVGDAPSIITEIGDQIMFEDMSLLIGVASYSIEDVDVFDWSIESDNFEGNLTIPGTMNIGTLIIEPATNWNTGDCVIAHCEGPDECPTYEQDECTVPCTWFENDNLDQCATITISVSTDDPNSDDPEDILVSAPVIFHLAVTPVNDAPQIYVNGVVEIDDQEIDEDGSLTVMLSYTDAEGG